MLRVLYIEISRVPARESHLLPRPGWRERGIDLTYVFFSPQGEELAPAPDAEMAFYPTGSASRLTFPLDALRLASRLHRQNPFNLVVANDPMILGLVGCCLKRRFHLPLVIKVHTQYFGHRRWVLERPYYPFYYLLIPLVLAQADMVWAVSQAVRDSLWPWMTAPGKIEVCPTPIYSQFFDFPPRPAEKPAGTRLLSVGFLNRQKGFDTLLQAMSLLVEAGQDPSLILVGSGPEEAALVHLAETLGIRKRVTFLGQVPLIQLAPLYHDCDVFVLPSRYEGLGRVLIEAAMAGAPIVTTAIGPSAEAVLPNRSALLAPPDDPAALAAAIGTLLDQPEMARAMGERGRQFARQQFNYDKMMDDVAGLWHQAAARKHSRKFSFHDRKFGL
jgi:glycosyltransferase involved in cell wall biosynthesis